MKKGRRILLLISIFESGFQEGILTVTPEMIHAQDMDGLNYPIQYEFHSGTPGYEEYFEIDISSGEIRQLKAIERSNFLEMNIIIKVRSNLIKQIFKAFLKS